MTNKPKNTSFLMRINNEDLEIIRILAKRYGMSTSRYIRLLIDLPVMEYKRQQRQKDGIK